MSEVARIVKERPATVARTLRALGTGLSDLGDSLSWGECLLLLESAASDPSTPLGAELAGWAYTASLRDLISLSAQIGDPKAAKKLMPWALDAPGKAEGAATDEEVAMANAELEDSMVFAS